MTISSQQDKLKIVFAGTPDFAATALQSLLVADLDIAAVYCQPDRPSGRGKKLTPGPVKVKAGAHHLPIEQPVNFKQPSAIERLKAYAPDLMVVVAYGLLLPAEVLAIPRYGCINIHASILPRWRGAAPIQRAIEAGDAQTGVTIMQMDKGLDTGNMLSQRLCPITPADTGQSLHDRLAQLGGEAIVDYLSTFEVDFKGQAQQDELANYANKLHKQEAEVDWQLPAQTIERKIRAFNAWPICFTFVDDKRLRLWQSSLTENSSDKPIGSVVAASKKGIEVVCGDQRTLLLTQLQPDGGKSMPAQALLNARGDWFKPGALLGKAGTNNSATNVDRV